MEDLLAEAIATKTAEVASKTLKHGVLQVDIKHEKESNVLIKKFIDEASHYFMKKGQDNRLRLSDMEHIEKLGLVICILMARLVGFGNLFLLSGWLKYKNFLVTLVCKSVAFGTAFTVEKIEDEMLRILEEEDVKLI